jgi:hypothetical protein
MQKQSAKKAHLGNSHQLEPNRYKDMNYANHPEKYPLQLEGRMKRHSQPHGQ